METLSILDGFIAPAGIAVVGASDDLRKPGGKIVANLLAKGYAGKLFLINPTSERIQDRPALASVRALPGPPDLAFIAIPARFVASALEDLAQIGTRRVVVLSAGFGETGAEGLSEERRLAQIADRHGMRLLGPNCLGVMSPVHAGKFAGLLPPMRPGGIDFISGSGATVDILAEQAVRRGLAFHTFVTVGNSAQTGVTEVLALYDDGYGPASSSHIMLYLEKVGSPREFLRHARSLTRKGCVLMAVKAGVTEAGRRAAASHTGAVATADTAVQALFDKAGIMRFQSKLDMVDAATALILAKGRYDGRRACVITDAGGPGVMITDELNRRGIAVPLLKVGTQQRLAGLLPPGAGVQNPVDVLPTRTPQQVAEVLEILCREEAGSVDYLMIQLGAPGFSDNWPVYQAVIDAMDRLPLPIFPSFATSISSSEALSRYRAAGKCHFEDEVSMARAVGRMVNRPRAVSSSPDPAGYDGAAAARLLKGLRGVVPLERTGQVLAAAGIPLPRQQVLTRRSELAALVDCLPPPWVMKVVGILHKSEVDGVVAGVGAGDAEETFERLMKIEGAEGVLVQETVVGPEVLLGLSRQGEFGHLVAFGLGGVMVEALGDVRFGLAPLTSQEAGTLVHSVRTLPVLEGIRGRAGMDLQRLVDLVVRVSLLARDVPAIREMDINPLMGTGSALYAADVRIILDRG